MTLIFFFFFLFEVTENDFCVQDVTHKVVEAIGTIAGSSLEQTTWLRRNLEVKASPQIVVDGTNLEADVEGVLLEEGSFFNICAQCGQGKDHICVCTRD